MTSTDPEDFLQPFQPGHVLRQRPQFAMTETDCIPTLTPYEITKVKALALGLVCDEEGRPIWISVDLGGGRCHIWRRENATSLFDRLAYEVRFGSFWGGSVVQETAKVRAIPANKKGKPKQKLHLNLDDLL